MNIGDLEKTICEMSREPDKTLQLLKAIEQQRFTDGREAEADKHRWILVTERLPTGKDGEKCRVKLAYERKYRENCVSVIIQDGIRSCESSFDLDKKEFCVNNESIIKWQPLPEV